jgi:hypothetical protein
LIVGQFVGGTARIPVVEIAGDIDVGCIGCVSGDSSEVDGELRGLQLQLRLRKAEMKCRFENET